MLIERLGDVLEELSGGGVSGDVGGEGGVVGGGYGWLLGWLDLTPL